MFKLFLCGLMILISGCGSITTLRESDARISQKLNDWNTQCESIPRIYSGVAYGFCVLHARPGHELAWDSSVIPYVFLDMGVSAIVDTLALPATIPAANSKGRIEIVHEGT